MSQCLILAGKTPRVRRVEELHDALKICARRVEEVCTTRRRATQRVEEAWTTRRRGMDDASMRYAQQK